MLIVLTRSLAAAGEMLQQVCRTAVLGSPAVTLVAACPEAEAIRDLVTGQQCPDSTRVH